MFWNRLFAGAGGLFLAFSSGGKLQLWLDEGKVWRARGGGRQPRLLTFDETPFSYVFEIGFYILFVFVGLALVWWALGGNFKKRFWKARLGSAKRYQGLFPFMAIAFAGLTRYHALLCVTGAQMEDHREAQG